VSLEHLWAGWRSAYVGLFSDDAEERPGDETEAGAAQPGGLAQATGALDDEDCVFCTVLRADGVSDRDRLVVRRSEHVVAMLNAYPYASGHLMVMPARHVRELEELTEDEAGELWQGIRGAVAAVKRAYKPDGANLGLNLGRAAGAGIPGHLHVHVVPRWLGDTNFMTATASVRVIPEALPETWERVNSAWS
jgi:ATP adenylyltransferase